MRYKNNTKEKISNKIKLKENLTSTDLQFVAGVGVDVVLMHLYSLEKKGKIKKERKGKRYITKSFGFEPAHKCAGLLRI